MVVPPGHANSLLAICEPKEGDIPVKVALLLLLVLGLNVAARADDRPLKFGLLPSESAMSKFRRYAPLREYLTQKLGRVVLLETASDFPTFTQRAESRAYDIVETAPHFVISTIEKGGYEVITTIVKPLTAQIVVLESSAVKRLAQLQGGRVATPSPRAIITRLGRDVFAQIDWPQGRQPVFESYPTHNAAYQAVLGNQADAAIISVNVYNKAIRKGLPLRSIAWSREIPNMSILVASDLPDELKNRLKTILVNMKSDAAGKAILKSMAYPGYRAASRQEYEQLDMYMKQSGQ